MFLRSQHSQLVQGLECGLGVRPPHQDLDKVAGMKLNKI